jgi:hypothetical protein
MLTSTREQGKAVSGWIREDGEPANTGNLSLEQNNFTTMSLDFGE